MAAASPPKVELTSPAPSSAPRDPAPAPALETSPSTDRRSRILSPADTAAKRLSTASNPSREAPKQPSLETPKQHGLPPSDISLGLYAAPQSIPSLGPSGARVPIPSFPPPQASRISMVSPSSTSLGIFHPQFASSLSYASVRDFAYPAMHPLHYGSTPTPDAATTPGLELQEAVAATGWFRRQSDPAVPSWAQLADDHVAAQFRQQRANHPPPLKFADGPPWSEDEDLASPVVVPKHAGHRKHKSSLPHHNSRNAQSKFTMEPPAFATGKEWRHSTGGTEVGASSYYRTSAGPQDLVDGEPGGELYHHAENDEYDPSSAGYYDPDYAYSDDEAGEFLEEDDTSVDDYSNRFSKVYQFTIASPAEEMHGKAVALFDFVQENENELPLVEGQVVWVSYRHGMGWLVAEDPKTGESGLVPEEYVCLIRDMHAAAAAAAAAELNPSALAPDSSTTTAAPEAEHHHHAHVSHFSTSSQDVHPYGYQLSHEESRERLEQIRREHEERAAAAVEEEEEEWGEEGTPRLRSDAFEVNGKKVEMGRAVGV